jgi:ABC-type branched-subunit amino acid transport system substrate-binding protein/streptogramin lyase
MSAAVAPGTTLAGYRVESLVGRGGMGIVYRATDLSLSRPVALKLIAPELAGDERFRARFLRESRLAASLDHPNVVPIYEAREAEGQLYLAMRFVEGSDLRTLLTREELGPERTLVILCQVAGALDAAHRRGLVHRDVKPGNVLVDQSGHAYLTDFGVTKQVGHASTETGQIVGTLDYLAPEQIRGDAVDGRADVYALACVLYECVAGAPPFRRETEAETLWAHMQEEPAPLPDHHALEPVLSRGLAKEREDRYASCADLIEGAEAALGLSPTIKGRLVPAQLVRRRRWILAAGLLVLAVTCAAATISLTGNGGADAPPVDNGIAAIGATKGRIGAFTKTQTPPSTIAVGEGAVWVLNTESKVVSRLDPKTGQVVDTFETGGQPSDVAAGAGAVWVGNAGKGENTATSSVSRVDPESTAVTRTVKLPAPRGGGGQSFAAGYPTIAVGAGGVWASTPDSRVARIDPETGRIKRVIKTEAKTLAAGAEGVWLLAFDRVVRRIDPRTNRVTNRIRIGSNFLSGIAVGGGSVWVTSEEGLLWRIQLGGSAPIMRSIDVGTGTAYVAYGAGAVWTANWVRGTVSRIDPRRNAVVATVPVGATQALAAGAGSAWVSVAGRPRDGTLPASTCSRIASGGRAPDVLIASDLPLQGESGTGSRAIVAAVRAVLADRGYRAGRFAVGYQSCDDSTAQTGGFEHRKCAANANAYARAKRLVAVIGPFNSFCAQIEIPILNAAPGGPLALLTPSSSFPNLTRGGELALPPPFGVRGEPGVYYPTGARNFLRVVAREDLSGVALAELARQLGLRSAYLLYDAPDGVGDVLFTDGFARAAPRLGLKVVGEEGFDTEARSYKRLVEKIARSGADGVVLGGHLDNGAELLKELRARLGPRTAILTGDGFGVIPAVISELGRAADGLYVVVPDVLPSALEPTAAGRRVVGTLGANAHAGYVMHAAAAAQVLVEAIARSDGTRASVLDQLHVVQVRRGIIGSFRFDRYGDMTPAKLTVMRIDVDAPRGKTLPGVYRGAVLDRVVTVPTT